MEALCAATGPLRAPLRPIRLRMRRSTRGRPAYIRGHEGIIVALAEQLD